MGASWERSGCVCGVGVGGADAVGSALAFGKFVALDGPNGGAIIGDKIVEEGDG